MPSSSSAYRPSTPPAQPGPHAPVPSAFSHPCQRPSPPPSPSTRLLRRAFARILKRERSLSPEPAAPTQRKGDLAAGDEEEVAEGTIAPENTAAAQRLLNQLHGDPTAPIQIPDDIKYAQEGTNVDREPRTTSGSYGKRTKHPNGYIDYRHLPRGKASAPLTAGKLWHCLTGAYLAVKNRTFRGVNRATWHKKLSEERVIEDRVRRAAEEGRKRMTSAGKALLERLLREDPELMKREFLNAHLQERLNAVFEVEKMRTDAGSDEIFSPQGGGHGVYGWFALKDLLEAVYVGRSDNMLARAGEHIAGIAAGSGSPVYQKAAQCEIAAMLPIYKAPGIDDAVDAEIVATLEGMRALLLGSYTRKEGMLALRRHYGLPSLDDTVVGCNSTPCLEKPTLLAEERDEHRTVKNAEYIRAMGRVRAYQRQLPEAVAAGERDAIQQYLQATRQAEEVLEQVRGRLLTSGTLRVDPSIKSLCGQWVPINFIDGMRLKTKGDWLIKLEQGDVDSLLSMTEPHRAPLGRLALKGRSADPNEPGEVL